MEERVIKGPPQDAGAAGANTNVEDRRAEVFASIDEPEEDSPQPLRILGGRVPVVVRRCGYDGEADPIRTQFAHKAAKYCRR